jgi:8-oxo-dGTP pyrophosphatase MutT (NUDIX family)
MTSQPSSASSDSVQPPTGAAGAAGALPRWEPLRRTTRHVTRVFDVDGVHYRHPVRGTEREFIVVRPPDWVNVVAVTGDERLVLVRQFRFGIDGFSLEIPGGVMEAGEDPVAAGLRELREETGYAGKTARLLGSVHPNPAIQANRCHFVLVEDAARVHASEWDADEEIEVTALPIEETLARARSGGITHALVLNALMLFEAQWRERRGRRTGGGV